jgi:hypothetical protein
LIFCAGRRSPRSYLGSGGKRPRPGLVATPPTFASTSSCA